MYKRSAGDRWFDVISVTLLVVLTAAVLYPLILIVSSSLSEPDQVNSGQVWLLPKSFTLEGYTRVFQYDMIWRAYLNTFLYTGLGIVINVSLTLTSAWALNKPELRGRHVLTFLFVMTMFFSGGIIPTFLLVKNLGMVDTIWAMVIPNAVSMWYILVARTFFATSIPREIEEAAQIDGCSHTRTFARIVLPLSAPIVTVMALFYGVGHWNTYFNALIYLSNHSLYPLQLVLREILVMNQISEMLAASTEQLESLARQAQYAELMKYCLIIVSMLPVLIVYPFAQKYFLKGVMIGAIKG